MVVFRLFPPVCGPQAICSATAEKAGITSLSRELRVVESKGIIEAPVVTLKAQPLL